MKRFTQWVKAFDNDGEEKWLSLGNDPTLPVILIRPKEDIDYTKYTPDNGTNLKSNRINGASEFIKQIGTDNIGAVEGWIWGGPRCEIKVITISSKTGSIFFLPIILIQRDVKLKINLKPLTIKLVRGIQIMMVNFGQCNGLKKMEEVV